MNLENLDITDELLEKVDSLPESERQVFLDKLPVKVRQQVERFLAADEVVQQKGLLQPVTGELGDIDEVKDIGPYKVISVLGKGGMGTVYEAQQDKPIKRRVAVKLINAGMDSKEIIARFEAERQALAMMEHPNIAKVLDAGTTDSGRPYFAMELVQGIPLTEYCDRNRLAANQRLNIFVAVCFAIQHAHQKGIIHRDIKPTNVLVCEENGEPIPKVIDFGLAKALHTSLTDRTVVTQFNQALGTVQYMSPEQTEVDAMDIDTRADIYSLGVMLYELLTGSTPINKETMSGMSLDRIFSVIREREPQTPSNRLSRSSADVVSSICSLRSTEPRQLQSILRGDLDWIVMKALEIDRNRRYETANSFAADVQRYLSNDVVLARPPSTGYRLQKFAGKNFKAVVAASTLLLVLGATSAISTWQYFKAESARETAQVAKIAADEARIAAEKSEKTVRAQATSVDEIGAFLAEIFKATRPAPMMGIEEERTDNRDRIVRICEDYKDEPAVQAGLMYLIGDAYIGMGRIREAAVFVREAHTIREQLFQNATDETRQEAELKLAQSMNQLAGICMFEWRNDEGREIASKAQVIHEAYFGPSHALTLESRITHAFGNFQGRFMSHNGKKRVAGIENSLKEWEAIYKIQKQKQTPGDRLVNQQLIIASHYIFLAGAQESTLEKLRYGAIAANHAASAMAAAGPRLQSDKALRLIAKFSEFHMQVSLENHTEAKAISEEGIALASELFYGNRENPVGLFALYHNTMKSIGDDEQPFETLMEVKQAYLRTYGEVPRTAYVIAELATKLFEDYEIRDFDEEQRRLFVDNLNEAIDMMAKCLGEKHYKVGHCRRMLGCLTYDYHRFRKTTDSPEVNFSENQLRKCLECYSESNTVGYRWADYKACYYLIEIAVVRDKATVDHLRPVLDHLNVWHKMDPSDSLLLHLLDRLPNDKLRSVVLGSEQ